MAEHQQDRLLTQLLAENGNDEGEVLYAKPVILKGVKKDQKPLEKCLVLGNYRFLIMEKSMKKLFKSCHYYDIREIASTDPNELNLRCRDFAFEMEGDNLGNDAGYLLKKCITKIVGCFPASSIPTFDPRLASISNEDHNYGLDMGFISTYRAYCNYYKTVASQSFIHYIESMKAIPHDGKGHDLHLNECSGIEPKTKYTFDLHPVAASLVHTKFFKSVTLRDVDRKESVSALSVAIKNPNLETFTISGVQADPESFVLLGSIMESSSTVSASIIDFSYNNMEDKGASGLASGILAMKKGISRLNLAYCQLQSKGISSLMKALDANHEASLAIQNLDLSGNNFGSAGTIALCTWLSNMKQGEENKSFLSELNLSDCQLDIFSLFQGLKGSIMDKLIHLNISKNKLTKQNVESVCEFLESTTVLKVLNISGCFLAPEVLEDLLNSLNKNIKIHQLRLILNGNDLGPNGAKSLCKIIRYSKNVHALELRSNDMKKEGLLQVFKTVEQNFDIKELDVSDNCKGKNLEVVKAVADTIALSHLDTLSISKNGLGKDMATIFKPLIGNNKLTSLDISGNDMGDIAATSLSEAILKNTTLKKLSWDENQITLGGYQAFGSALKNNKTMVEVPNPSRDIQKAISSSKDKTRQREKISEVIDQINATLKSNPK